MIAASTDTANMVTYIMVLGARKYGVPGTTA